jgi:hypothetical protein
LRNPFEGLPRRDLWLLPLVSLMTVVILLSASEVLARVVWSEHLEDSCARHDPVLGTRFAANCHSFVKSAESPRVENTYNSCGFRSAGSCGPKSAGTFRVAVIGTSTGSGYLVPYADTFYARAAAQIGQQCHIPTDFQNLAIPGVSPENALLRLDSALALKPNLVLMPVSAHDIDIIQLDGQGAAAPPATPTHLSPKEVATQLVKVLRSSRVMLMGQHFLYMNEDEYLPLYLQHGEEADFLRPPLSPVWQAKLALFDQEVATIAQRANAKGASFMIVYVPQRAQALLLKWRHLPKGVEPSLLGRDIGEIAARHDVGYLDLTKTIGDRPDVVSLFYPVDSHPDVAGSEIIGQSVANALVAQDSALARCRERMAAAQ